MKRSILILSAILFVSVCSCDKQEDAPVPGPERELSIPEKVEKEIMDVMARDWKSLSDTLAYFDSTMLLKGRMRGKAPDGVYYELAVSTRKAQGLEASFKVEDSTWAALSGRILPLEIDLKACDVEIALRREEKDSCSLSVSDVKVIAPASFLLKDGHQAPLLYKEQRVGYLTREEFENTDYSTGSYLLIRYYNDNRSFAIYDNGLCGLLKMNLPDVIK